MPSNECRRVFTQILPTEKFKSVYELVMAERVSKAVLCSMDWDRGHDAETRIRHPHILVHNIQDMPKLFPDSDVCSFVESIVPNNQLLGEKDWDDSAMGRLQKAWSGMDSLYTIHGDITRKDLLIVSNDERGGELWHQWHVNG